MRRQHDLRRRRQLRPQPTQMRQRQVGGFVSDDERRARCFIGLLVQARRRCVHVGEDLRRPAQCLQAALERAIGDRVFTDQPGAGATGVDGRHVMRDRAGHAGHQREQHAFGRNADERQLTADGAAHAGRSARVRGRCVTFDARLFVQLQPAEHMRDHVVGNRRSGARRLDDQPALRRADAVDIGSKKNKAAIDDLDRGAEHLVQRQTQFLRIAGDVDRRTAVIEHALHALCCGDRHDMLGALSEQVAEDRWRQRSTHLTISP